MRMTCPQFKNKSVDLQSNTGCIACRRGKGITEYQNMTATQAENVSATLCHGAFTSCNYYNSHAFPEKDPKGSKNLFCQHFYDFPGKIICIDPKTGAILKSRFMSDDQREDILKTFCQSPNYKRCGMYKKFNAAKAEEEKTMTESTQLTTVSEQTTLPSEVVREAQRYHAEIVSNIAVTESALIKICQSLKKIRDRELYKALGFENFGDYVERNGDYAFKERQAYTYIATYERLGERYITEHAQAGITKLSLITQLSAFEREEAFEDAKIEGLSTAEIKEIIEKYRKQGEQLSLLGDDKEDKTNEVEELKRALENEKAAAANARLIAVEAARKQGAEEAIREFAKNHQAEDMEKEKRIKALEKELKEQRPADEVIATAVKKATEETNEAFTAKIKELEEEKLAASKKAKQALAAEKEKAEKAILQANADESIVAFKLYFNEMQKNLKSFLETIEAVPDEKRKAEFRGAFIKYLDAIKAGLGA